MQDGPDVVDDLAVRARHVEVEPVDILPLEVPEKRLAVSGGEHHPADRLALEEGVKLGDGSVQGLGGSTASQLKLLLLSGRVGAARE